MPPQTNDFQQLVHLIQKALFPIGAKVTESAMVTGTDSTKLREVDILVETEVGPCRISVAVEAKDEGRKMDLVRFESILGKYKVSGGVVVDKIVVVARKGFTKEVYARAGKLGVELFTLAKAATVDWSRLRPPDACLRSAVELTDYQINGRSVSELFGNTPTEVQVECHNGVYRGNVVDFAKQVFWKFVLKREREQLLRIDDTISDIILEKKFKIDFNPAPAYLTRAVTPASVVEIEEFTFNVQLYRSTEATNEFPGDFSLAHPPHVCHVSFTPQINATGKELLHNGRVKCTCCGRDHGTVKEWATKRGIHQFFAKNVDAQRMLADGVRRSPDGNAMLRASWPFCSKHRIVLGEVEHAATSVEIGIHAVRAKGKLIHKQMELSKADGSKSLIDCFEAIVGQQRVRMVLPDGIRSKQISVRLDKAESNSSARPTKRKKEGAKNTRKTSARTRCGKLSDEDLKQLRKGS